MNPETRQCQNCKNAFVIEAQDFEFYKKIDVSSPTWCPECRRQRRLAFRNERSLHHRMCDLCKKDIISRYPAEVPSPVYCPDCWRSDNWDPLDYGREYDFSKPFFLQFKELWDTVPQLALATVNSINSNYANHVLDSKNVYLSISTVRSENIYYSYRTDDSRDIFDSAYSYHSEKCLEVIDTHASNKVGFGQYVQECLNSQFLYDVRNSQNCLASVNLRNAKYQIFNMEYSEEEYRRILEKYDLGSYRNSIDFEKKFKEHNLRYPRRYAVLNKCQNVTGNNVENSKNSAFCFDGYDIENSKFLIMAVDGAKDCYDLTLSGIKAELCYEAISTMGSRNRFSVGAYGQDMEYVWDCYSKTATHLFGCISIGKKKDFCILNKQYTEEEYGRMIQKIKKHMEEMPHKDKQGRVFHYGEFFPPGISPFGYNETLAYEYSPLSREEAEEKGFVWKENLRKKPAVTLSFEDMPDHIRETRDEITKEIIGCIHQGQCADRCTEGFRVLPEELTLYREFNLPLPRLCPNCRHAQRVGQREGFQLHKRQCQCAGKSSEEGIYENTGTHSHGEAHCPNTFQTTYAPDRPEIVYCEACYQAEVV
ncbi:MAG: hypothetical protein AAB691_00720 [Patescibacteria group bacterium]